MPGNWRSAAVSVMMAGGSMRRRKNYEGRMKK
jgi:hypothetical protein